MVQKREEEAIAQFASLSSKVTLMMIERRWKRVARQQNAQILENYKKQLKQQQQHHHHLISPMSPPTSPDHQNDIIMSNNNSYQKQAAPLPPPRLQDETLPLDYAQYYDSLLDTIVLNTLSVIRPSPETLLLALYYISKLVAVPSLPESMATPTRLLMAGLILADVVHSDEGAVPARAWNWVIDKCKVEKLDGMTIPQLKMDALVALGFKTHVAVKDWDEWIEFIKDVAK